ncbi:GNAT family N-acetyltransferase [Pseudoalteromonas fenneropenaei]|uniref:GNAT family N-acetyltransferase n=1 Tax=Pseudoalteromonas fenneropenaei TaxID=1737459 RepID=A0ABV7CG27_9GAMM
MLSPVTLQSYKVTLEPLNKAHLLGLLAAGQDPQIWQWLLQNFCASEDVLAKWFTDTAQFDATSQLVFATTLTATGEVIGTTRFFRYDQSQLKVEIGHTFITPKWQRSFVNTHAKYLMLKHAFEDLQLVRVELRTHENNQKSRNAMLRIGATFEGISRKDRRLGQGPFRNSAWFSIIDDDWAQIKTALEQQL